MDAIPSSRIQPLLGSPSRESSTLSIAPHMGKLNTESQHAAVRNVRDIVRIGQVWRHRAHGSTIRIKQIHRADRTVEAWLQLPGVARARQLPFAELRRDYQLADAPAAQPAAGDRAA
jgi:hypothetical protein